MQHARRLPALLSAVAVFSGCAWLDGSERRWVTYACEEGKTAVVGVAGPQEPVELRVAGRTVALEPVPTASGARYADGKIAFWVKDPEALLIDETTGEQWRCRRQTAE